MAHDIVEALRLLGVSGAVGIGHSFGGFVLAHAALEDRSLFRALLLVDPTIFPAAFYAEWSPPREGKQSFSEFVKRRYNQFTSPEEMFRRLHGKGSYKSWTDECLADYCQFGLMSHGALEHAHLRTGWTLDHSPPHVYHRQRLVSFPSWRKWWLACPPHLESATYMGSTAWSDRDRYAELTMPVRVLRAEKPASVTGDFTGSPTDPKLASCFPRGRDFHLVGFTHFIPMQDPGLVATHLQEMAMEAPPSAELPRSRL